MRMNTFLSIIMSICFALSFSSCRTQIKKTDEPYTAPAQTEIAATKSPSERVNPYKPTDTKPKLQIEVNGEVLYAVFENNSSADAFIELLKQGSVTVAMHDYGNFEKVGDLGHTLPRNDTEITTEPGDVILYQGNQITIYYDVNTWSFTRLAKIENITQTELKEFLGDGNVSVTFSLYNR